MSSARAVRMDPRISARREAVEQEALRKRGRQWLAALLIVLAFAAGVAALQSSLLDVDRIVVHGALVTSPEQVAAVSEVVIAEPLYTVDLDRAVQAIATLPLVDEVQAQRSWNGSVSIEISERDAVAQISTESGLVIVDAAGRVLSVEPELHPTLPRIDGLELATAPGRWVDDDVVALTAIATALPEDVAIATDAIVLGESGVELRIVRRAQNQLGAVRAVSNDGAADLTDAAEVAGPDVQFSRVLLGDDRELAEKFWSIRAFLFGVDVACFATLDVRAPSVPVLTRHESCPTI